MSTTYQYLRSEETEQEVVMRWARMNVGRHPELELLYHCPNGGSRNKREAARLKRMGVLAGVPDLHLPVAEGPYYSLYIEMKFGEGRLQPSQREFMKRAAHFHSLCVVCYTAEDAIEILHNYVEYKKPLHIENLSIWKNGEMIGKIK